MKSKAFIQEAIQFLQSTTIPLEEIRSMVFLLAEGLFGFKKTLLLTDTLLQLTDSELQLWQNGLEKLAQNEPVQYVLGFADFYGRKFQVNPAVLIPRPETEELIQLILQDAHTFPSRVKILDIGTGSGCIAITLAKEIPHCEVFALDISDEALQVAKANAEDLQTPIHFLQVDILQENPLLSPILPYSLDLIVSNPPYVALSEKILMQKNVLEYEPYMALFVTDENPLIFYEKILFLAQIYLKNSGKVYFEINEHFGKEMIKLAENNGFEEIALTQDIQGKDRILKVTFKKIDFLALNFS